MVLLYSDVLPMMVLPDSVSLPPVVLLEFVLLPAVVSRGVVLLIVGAAGICTAHVGVARIRCIARDGAEVRGVARVKLQVLLKWPFQRVHQDCCLHH